MSSENNKPPSAIKQFMSARVAGAKAGIASARDATASTLRNLADRVEGPVESFEVANQRIPFQIDSERGTIWATQQQIADLYGRDKATIREHLKNLYDNNELDKDSVEGNFPSTGPDGKTYQVIHYRLAAILKVGFKVHSPRAAEFREWAAQKLDRYVVAGFVLDEARLRSDPDALAALTDRVRTLRAHEQCFYARVRDCFKMSASDYDPASEAARLFYARAQNMVLYAVSEQTAADLILRRADAAQHHMGLSSFDGDRPKTKDITIGKNYLKADELALLKIISDQFLSFVESKAMRGKQMTMDRLLEKLTDLLELNEFPVQPGTYFGSSREQAERHAKRQLRTYQAKLAVDAIKAPLRRLPGR